jgi:hypothetical protein
MKKLTSYAVLLLITIAFSNCAKNSSGEATSASQSVEASSEADMESRASSGATSCLVNINDSTLSCFNKARAAGVRMHPFNTKTLADTYVGANNNAYRCIKRAIEYRDWCVAQGIAVGGVSATFYVGSTPLISGAVNNYDNNTYIHNGLDWNSYMTATVTK